MPDSSSRLQLPYLLPGQAQKELFHNEALAMLDLAVQASVVAVGTDAPPTAPVAGACWIVGSDPSGAWAGHAGTLAGWTAGGWRFVSPPEGFAVWDQSTGRIVRRFGTTWLVGAVAADRVVVAGTQVVGAQRAAIAAPTGGDVADLEARSAIAAMLDALRGHGLIAR